MADEHASVLRVGTPRDKDYINGRFQLVRAQSKEFPVHRQSFFVPKLWKLTEGDRFWGYPDDSIIPTMFEIIAGTCVFLPSTKAKIAMSPVTIEKDMTRECVVFKTEEEQKKYVAVTGRYLCSPDAEYNECFFAPRSLNLKVGDTFTGMAYGPAGTKSHNLEAYRFQVTAVSKSFSRHLKLRMVCGSDMKAKTFPATCEQRGTLPEDRRAHYAIVSIEPAGGLTARPWYFVPIGWHPKIGDTLHVEYAGKRTTGTILAFHAWDDHKHIQLQIARGLDNAEEEEVFTVMPVPVADCNTHGKIPHMDLCLYEIAECRFEGTPHKSYKYYVPKSWECVKGDKIVVDTSNYTDYSDPHTVEILKMHDVHATTMPLKKAVRPTKQLKSKPKKEQSDMSARDVIKIEHLTLINGQSVKDLSDTQLFTLISQAEKQIEDLEKIKTKPARLVNAINAQKKALADLVALLDASEPAATLSCVLDMSASPDNG